MMDIAVVILAGGDGVRMGGDKPLRLLAGRNLLDHMVDKARVYSDRVAVSLRYDGQFPVPPHIAVIVDEHDEEGGLGPVAGVRSAGAFAKRKGCDAVLTLPCDTPFLPVDLARRLSAALAEAPEKGVALAMSGDRLHPVCGLWRCAVFDGKEDARGGSLREFAEKHGFAAVKWVTDPFDPFLNINSRDDLLAAERLCLTC